jgi:glycerol-3-phosphate dehydrogenase
VGYRLGKGETIEEITDSQQQVAEGVPTAPEVLELAKKHKCFAPVLASATKVTHLIVVSCWGAKNLQATCKGHMAQQASCCMRFYC